ncbi:MAG: tetratricopeptide repeat protein [Planctomycetota bacterium]|jgi:tetratricopeptide (TPR) repeat protein
MSRVDGKDSNNSQATNRPVVLLVCLMLLVAGAVFFTYLPVLSANALTFDDNEYLVDNRLVQNPSWSSAGRFLSEVSRPSTVRGYYQPLSMISLMLDYSMGGRADALWTFHLTSLLLHLANVLSVMLLLYMLFSNPWASALVGLLFGVHPMTVEAIGWVAERKTVLSTFFALWSLIVYVRYARRGSWPLYAVSMLSCVLALLSKPTTVPLPAVMMLLDIWPLRRFNVRSVLDKLPFFVVCGLSVCITFVSQKNTASMFVYVDSDVVLRPVLIICHNIIFYLRNIFWPVDLVPHYPYPQPLGIEHSRVLAGVIGTCVLIPMLLVSLRWTRALAVGWLIFFVAIFPAIGAIGFTTTIAADRFVYFPMMGLLLILVWLATGLWNASGKSYKRIVPVAAVLVLAGLESANTRKYLSQWQESEKLYRYMLSIVPEAPIPHHNLGYILDQKGRIDEAIEEYKIALRLKPNSSKVYYNLGIVLFKKGVHDESVRHFEEALRLKPTNSQFHNNLGVVLVEMGRLDDAINHFSLARHYDPSYPEAQNNLANALCKKERYVEAVELYRDELARFPDRVGTYGSLAYALGKTGKGAESIEYYEKSLVFDPGNFDVHTSLGNSYYKLNRTEKAVQHFGQAVKLRPDSSIAHTNLALGLAKQGKTAEAVGEYRQALRLKPDNYEAHYCLGNALIKLRKLPEAVKHYSEAVGIKPEALNARYNLANALTELGRIDEAIGHYKELLRMVPGHQETQKALNAALSIQQQSIQKR